MNQMTAPPRLEIIPPTAPFTEGQRSWLNGFLVGLLQLDGSTPLAPLTRSIDIAASSAVTPRRSANADSSVAQYRWVYSSQNPGEL